MKKIFSASFLVFFCFIGQGHGETNVGDVRLIIYGDYVNRVLNVAVKNRAFHFEGELDPVDHEKFTFDVNTLGMSLDPGSNIVKLIAMASVRGSDWYHSWWLFGRITWLGVCYDMDGYIVSDSAIRIEGDMNNGYNMGLNFTNTKVQIIYAKDLAVVIGYFINNFANMFIPPFINFNIGLDIFKGDFGEYFSEPAVTIIDNGVVLSMQAK